MRKQFPLGTPQPPAEMLYPGPLVFSPPEHAVSIREFRRWWSWTHGASLTQPQSPGSSVQGMGDRSVVHAFWVDSVAHSSG